ncbi:LPS translocon maturation chaperone LptM [Chitinibacter sp. S2-10]|uniref:LPS translocon maturation chaperone LptM n=1 Tax=Chitinibacter sp. S2-10 TaxID=3373597 RepID=UPI003977D07A
MLNCNFATVIQFMRALTVFIFVATLLTACGYKGPLYLPKNGPAKPASAASEISTPAEPLSNAASALESDAQ